ncbi:Phosphoribosylglycinamide formyltransferase, partial [hydrothermal vent metagenome]
ALTLVILISGRGSNLKAILDAISSGELNAEVCAVISSQADAAGLDYARQHQVDTLALDSDDYPSREQYDRALQGLIDRFNPDLVVLAGFLRILTPELVRHYQGRMINIHPSLLPALPGLNTHQRAIDAGLHEHGASVHFVTEELDGGPVIVQARVPVLADDNAEKLANRVLAREHDLYLQALRWLVAGRIQCTGGQLLYDAQPLKQPLLLDSDV